MKKINLILLGLINKNNFLLSELNHLSKNLCMDSMSTSELLQYVHV